jgi:glucokinase
MTSQKEIPYHIAASDCGGNKLITVICDNSANELARVKYSTKTIKGRNLPDLKISAIKEALYIARQKTNIDKISSIVDSQGGLCDSKNGIIRNGPNIEDCIDIDMATPIKNEFEAPYEIHNDGNCGAYGVYKEDKRAKKFYTMTYFIVGSGFGAGHIENGRIYTGPLEIGHITINKDGPKCNCGKFGCVEKYVGGDHFPRTLGDTYLHHGKNVPLELTLETLKSKDIFDAARKGDGVAKEVVDDFNTYLAIGISTVCNLLWPKAVFLGESMLKDDDLIIPELKNKLPDYLMNKILMPQVYKTEVSEPCLRGAVHQAIYLAENSK